MQRSNGNKSRLKASVLKYAIALQRLERRHREAYQSRKIRDQGPDPIHLQPNTHRISAVSLRNIILDLCQQLQSRGAKQHMTHTEHQTKPIPPF